ncbi:hypothetical protein ACQ0QQ_19265 [Lysinibacillus sphaericus]
MNEGQNQSLCLLKIVYRVQDTDCCQRGKAQLSRFRRNYLESGVIITIPAQLSGKYTVLGETPQEHRNEEAHQPPSESEVLHGNQQRRCKESNKLRSQTQLLYLGLPKNQTAHWLPAKRVVLYGNEKG